MGRLVDAFPDDAEARAFHALSQLGLNQGVRDVPTYLRAAAIAEEIFRDHPNHPGAAHYLIHAYDDPVHAPLGLRAARAYSRIAPDAAHAQHMTTHIFVAMGMWDEVVSQNDIAANLTAWVPGHYTDWLGYGLLQQGRRRDALAHLTRVRGNMGESPRQRHRWHLADMRAQYVVNTEEWNSPVLQWTIDVAGLEPRIRAEDQFVLGWAALKRGDRAAAEGALSTIADLARGSGDGEPDRVPTILEKELRAALALADGRRDEALFLMREAAALEDAMPFEFGPPAVVKPTHELLGEMLLELRQPREAQSELERALRLAPMRAAALLGLGRAAAAAGDWQTAARAFGQLRDIWRRADPGVPGLEEAARFVSASR